MGMRLARGGTRESAWGNLGHRALETIQALLVATMTAVKHSPSVGQHRTAHDARQHEPERNPRRRDPHESRDEVRRGGTENATRQRLDRQHAAKKRLLVHERVGA